MNDIDEKTTIMVTKYGPVKNNGDLGDLDRGLFLKWVNEHRKNYLESENFSEEKWIILYKNSLREEYVKKYFNLAEKIP